MNRTANVYIIILNFNSYRETIECIESLNKINYRNYTIVIVDNNSNDNSFSILKEKYPNIEILSSRHNWGYANGNNIGIQYAIKQGADYICILNNDVIVEENFLNPLIETLESDNNIGAIGPCICEYGDKNIVQAMGANINFYVGLALGKYKGVKYDAIKQSTVEVDYIGGACFIVRTEVFKEIGLIPENYFLFYEETEFCLNVRRSGRELLVLRNSKVYHKQSATISKFKGLSYYFLNRNRVVFMRRNANAIQRTIFYIYLFIEAIGRILIRREPLKLFKIYYEGIKTDINSIDFESIKNFIN